MRGIIFSHKGISTAQQGVQSLHVATEMQNMWPAGSPQREMYDEWVREHKTVILLNGGFSKTLKQLKKSIENIGDEYKLPYAAFYEDEDTFEGIMTAVGIIVPSYGRTPDISVRDEVDNSNCDTSYELAGMDSHYSLCERLTLLTHGFKLIS